MNKFILPISLGNFIEWYDFGLFAILSPLFATLYFPHEDHRIAMLSVFAIFASGFICRPIGGILFGHFGDKVGRIKTLRASILLITLPTLLMAFVPTYEVAGIYGSFILVALRIIQGISLGGEFTGSIIYLTETASPKRAGFASSFAGNAANVGILAATAIVFVLEKIMSTAHFQLWGWRLAFLLAGIISFIVMYARLNLVDSTIFKLQVAEKKIKTLPLLSAFREVPWVMLRIVGLSMFGAVFYFTCFIYLQEYFVNVLHVSESTALKIQMVALASMIFTVPLGGWLCDYWGRRKSFLIMTTSLLIAALPCFYLMGTHQLGYIILSMAIFTLISSLDQGTTSVTVVEQFPPNLRYSGLSFSYNVTQALFGGTAPLVAAFLIFYCGTSLAPVYYLLAIAAVTWLTAFFTLKKMK